MNGKVYGGAFVRDEMRVGQATETPSASASSSYLICRSTVIGSFGWVLVLAGGSTAALCPAAPWLRVGISNTVVYSVVYSKAIIL
jgi:hypothetical protein